MAIQFYFKLLFTVKLLFALLKNVIWMWWDKFWSEQLPNNSQLPSVTAVYIHHVIY